MMQYFPLFLDLKNRKVLVVGNGAETEQKIQQLLETGALIEVISDEPIAEVLQLAGAGKLTYKRKQFEDSDLDDAWLVIGTSEDDGELNKKIARAAELRRIFYNIVNVKNLCACIYPAVVSRKDLHIAISTSGNSPALAQRVKQEILDTIGPEYGVLNEILGEIRNDVIKKITDKEIRKKIFHALISAEIFELIKNNKIHLAKERMKEIIERETSNVRRETSAGTRPFVPRLERLCERLFLPNLSFRKNLF